MINIPGHDPPTDVSMQMDSTCVYQHTTSTTTTTTTTTTYVPKTIMTHSPTSTLDDTTTSTMEQQLLLYKSAYTYISYSTTFDNNIFTS